MWLIRVMCQTLIALVRKFVCQPVNGAVDQDVDRTMVGAVYWAVDVPNAVYWAVHWAVSRAVCDVVYEAVERTVHWPVYRDVGDAVGGAVILAVRNDPPHPALRDFLTRTAAATP